ncbi:RICIN domain-containing protein [Polyangium mundeleinium]|uniref:Ricin-type beta-trefoil lectin domain protein n=1 Tax=Polyangium mundeleinium TaxID=2995306 RepID=A0ABT5EXM8_9BACT|nr:ricin-type beta-trefoil lectin domain protein [Polyangium mundeleinium]MDC0746573.1 ricin-type beta-trefoil lectin domain protein [Polyangium mundeleinium]
MKHGLPLSWFVALTSAAALLWCTPAAAETDETAEGAETLLEAEDVEDSGEVAEVELAVTVFNRRIRNVGSGRCVSTVGAEAIPRLTNCSTASTHRWDIIQLPNGQHMIRSTNPQQNGRCLSIAGEVIRPGSIAFMGRCGDRAARRWRIGNAAPRTICVTAQNNTLCLANVPVGTPVRVQPSSGGVNQLWQFP